MLVSQQYVLVLFNDTRNLIKFKVTVEPEGQAGPSDNLNLFLGSVRGMLKRYPGFNML